MTACIFAAWFQHLGSQQLALSTTHISSESLLQVVKAGALAVASATKEL